MSHSGKPTIIVVPGAWHPASCVDAFIQSLQAAGFPAKGVTLRSVGHADVSVSDDETYLRSVMEPRIEEGEDVVLIVHSYAGFPGTAAIAGLDKRGRRARGEAGGVLGIIYLASFIPREKDTIRSLLGNKLLWWMKDNASSYLA
ncbi:hypothetical protein ACHAPT_012463 [Fusarium lateritium]